MVVVVLGMHRARTSLVANVLHHLGVHMGDRLLRANEWNPYGHWEDLDFFDLNVEMLRAAGGDWADPPSTLGIRATAEWFGPEVRALVDWKRKQGRAAWGWKDPRTCLTAWAYHGYLRAEDEVRYVHVVRHEEDIVDSLMRRQAGAVAMVEEWVIEGRVTEEEAARDREMATWPADRWAALVHEYEGRVVEFLQEEQPLVMTVDTDLVMRGAEWARAFVRDLAHYVDVRDEGVIEGAVGRIEIRDWRLEIDGLVDDWSYGVPCGRQGGAVIGWPDDLWPGQLWRV